MKTIQWLVLSALMAGMAAPASAGVNDPEVIIYRFPGVLDNGFPSNMGRATAFHCTNFSGVPETIRVAVRDLDGNLVSNFPATTAHLQTKTFTTHITLVYPATQLNLATGVVLLGTAAIAATSINVVCTAVSIDASLTTLQGYALHGIRFNPPPGSQE